MQNYRKFPLDSKTQLFSVEARAGERRQAPLPVPPPPKRACCNLLSPKAWQLRSGKRDRGCVMALERGRRHLPGDAGGRSEEHTSELQSLMRISYAVFCLKKKKTQPTHSVYWRKWHKYKSHKQMNT